MLVPAPSAVPAGQGDDPLAGSEPLAARVAAGPGLWDDGDWLAELRRDGLIGDLLAAGTIGQAAAEGGHGHRLERALTAEMTLLALVTGALFPAQGYDMVLARAFAMPGTRIRPGTPVPAGPAFSQGRARLGEQPARRAFELDAARDDVPLAAGGTAFGLELVIFDGTTLDLFSCPELAAEFGVPEGGRHPKLRVVAFAAGRDDAMEGRRDRRLPRRGERSRRPARRHSRPRGSSASPTAASSPWTGGCASPPPARIFSGGSRTPPALSRSASSGS